MQPHRIVTVEVCHSTMEVCHHMVIDICIMSAKMVVYGGTMVLDNTVVSWCWIVWWWQIWWCQIVQWSHVVYGEDWRYVEWWHMVVVDYEYENEVVGCKVWGWWCRVSSASVNLYNKHKYSGHEYMDVSNMVTVMVWSRVGWLVMLCDGWHTKFCNELHSV